MALYLVSYDLNKYPRGEAVPLSDYSYLNDFIADSYTTIKTDEKLTTVILLRTNKNRATVEQEILSYMKKRRFTAASIDLLVVRIYGHLPLRKIISRTKLNSP